MVAVAAAASMRRVQQQQQQEQQQQQQEQQQETLPDFWAYQTCSEFGGYMTCDVGSRCFFSQVWQPSTLLKLDGIYHSIAQGLLTLPLLMSFCPATFHISPDAVVGNVAATNERYGGADPAVSCAVYANGEVDPFAPMGVLQAAPSRSLFAFSVPGKALNAQSVSLCMQGLLQRSLHSDGGA